MHYILFSSSFGYGSGHDTELLWCSAILEQQLGKVDKLPRRMV